MSILDISVADRLAVALEEALDADVDAANNLEEAIDLEGSAGTDLVDEENGVLDNTETSKAVDVATNLAADVNVVLAALGAVRDTVVDSAVSEAETAGQALEGVTNGERETTSDGTRADRVTVLVGVEESDGIDRALEVETGKTRADGLEASTNLGGDINGLATVEIDLSTNGERSKEDSVLEAGLAVRVLGVVLDDLVRGGSAVRAELDINTSLDVGTGGRLSVAAAGLLAGTSLGLSIPGLADGARAGLGPRAVRHGTRAREAGESAGLESGSRGIEVDGVVGRRDAGNGGIEEGIRGRNGGSHGGHRGQSNEDVREVHVCWLFRRKARVCR